MSKAKLIGAAAERPGDLCGLADRAGAYRGRPGRVGCLSSFFFCGVCVCARLAVSISGCSSMLGFYPLSGEFREVGVPLPPEDIEIGPARWLAEGGCETPRSPFEGVRLPQPQNGFE